MTTTPELGCVACDAVGSVDSLADAVAAGMALETYRHAAPNELQADRVCALCVHHQRVYGAFVNRPRAAEAQRPRLVREGVVWAAVCGFQLACASELLGRDLKGHEAYVRSVVEAQWFNPWITGPLEALLLVACVAAIVYLARKGAT